MKCRLHLTILALLLCFGAAKAQSPYFGVNYSVLATSMTDRDNWGNEDYNYLFRVGHAPGLIAGYQFTNIIAFHSEVNYAFLGAKTEHFKNGKAFEKTIKSEYIQVPLMLKVSSGEFNSRFVAMIGPQLGFLTNGRRTITGEAAVENENIQSQMRNFDVGLTGHLGGEFRMGKRTWFTAGLRGNYGFTNVNKDGVPLLSDIPFIKQALNNVSGGVNVGLLILLHPERCEVIPSAEE